MYYILPLLQRRKSNVRLYQVLLYLKVQLPQLENIFLCSIFGTSQSENL